MPEILAESPIPFPLKRKWQIPFDGSMIELMEQLQNVILAGPKSSKTLKYVCHFESKWDYSLAQSNALLNGATKSRDLLVLFSE